MTACGGSVILSAASQTGGMILVVIDEYCADERGR